MTLTRQRKASFGLLAVALAALGADRLFLSGGSPATASAAAGDPVVVESDVAQARPAQTGPGLASRLESIARAEGLDPVLVEDLFADEAEAEPLVLTATLGTGRHAAAMVNGEQLRVGQSIAGAELVEVTRDGAQFRRDGETFFVALPRPGFDLRSPPKSQGGGGE
jgi:hypothetical protein